MSSSWHNAFLDPTKPGNFRDEGVKEIQRATSFRDKESGIPGAVEPTPEDLVANVEEYRISAGDVLRIQILDFLEPNVESEFTPTVDELGYIDIPQLDWIKVEDMTARDVKIQIIQRSKDAGIFGQDANPTVVVSLLAQRNRLFTIEGAIPAPGQYMIPRSDFRLREAIITGGGLDPTVKMIYVLRDEPRHKRIADREIYPPSIDGTGEPTYPAPPVAPILPAEFSGMAGSPPATTTDPAAPSSRDEAGVRKIGLPVEEAEQLLIEAVIPGETIPTTRSAATVPSDASIEEPVTGVTLPTYIYLNNAFIEAPFETQATQAATATTPSEPAAEVAPPEEPADTVDWEELASEGQQRIIRIPAEKLRRGDSSYNIVIRHQDSITLDPGPVGVFYLSGEVNRPGVYSLNGEEVTLRQAIAAAGGLNALAWPSRCEIIRRIDGDREEMTQWNLARIIEMKDPDLFLKPHDVVHVGTHAIAPLLATIRNSFRFTYGFGFVYDRNFADIDAYFAKENPEGRRRRELQTRFPGLVP